MEPWIRSHLERLGQSAFRLRAPGLVAYIDLYEPPVDPVKADLVLITHPHPDHFHPNAVNAVLKPGTVVVAPRSMAGAQGLATLSVDPGQEFEAAGLSMRAHRAYNLGKPFHPRKADWVGYEFVWDGVRVYHAGDTDRIPELAEVRCDVALLPVGGLFTMNPAEAAQAAAGWGSPAVVPMHYGRLPFTHGAGRAFARLWSGTSVLLERP